MDSINILKDYFNNLSIEKIDYTLYDIHDFRYIDKTCYSMLYPFEHDLNGLELKNTIHVNDSAMKIVFDIFRLVFKLDDSEINMVISTLNLLDRDINPDTQIDNWGCSLYYNTFGEIFITFSGNFFICFNGENYYFKAQNRHSIQLKTIYELKSICAEYVENLACSFYKKREISNDLLLSFKKYTTKEIIDYYGRANGFNYIGLKETQLFFKSKGLNPLCCKDMPFDKDNVFILKDYLRNVLSIPDKECIDDLFKYIFLILKCSNKKEIIYFSVCDNSKEDLNRKSMQCYQLQYDVNILCLGYDFNYMSPYNHVSEQELNIFYTTLVGVYAQTLKKILEIEMDLLNMRVASRLEKKSDEVTDLDYDLYNIIEY